MYLLLVSLYGVSDACLFSHVLGLKGGWAGLIVVME